MSAINDAVVGFEINMLFQDDNGEGTLHLGWCNESVGSIVKILDVSTLRNLDCLQQDDPLM